MTRTWIKTNAAVYHAIYATHRKDFSVFETLTDTVGEFGQPTILTAWGFKDADAPLIKSIGKLPYGLDSKVGNWEYEYFIASVREEADD